VKLSTITEGMRPILNDFQELETLLKTTLAERFMLVTEVFSVDGHLAQKKDCGSDSLKAPVIDERLTW
jgi:hypothetical protein